MVKKIRKEKENLCIILNDLEHVRISTSLYMQLSGFCILSVFILSTVIIFGKEIVEFIVNFYSRLT